MADLPPTAAHLRQLMATMLAGVTQGGEEMWWTLIGEVERLPIVMDTRCDWKVSPAGTPQEMSTIAHTVALVQAEHPHLA